MTNPSNTKPDRLQRLLSTATSLEPTARRIYIIRGYITLAVGSVLLLIIGALVMWWLSTGNYPLAAAGALFGVCAGIIGWAGTLVGLNNMRRLWGRWTPETISASPDQFRNEAALVAPLPTWQPLSLVALGVALACLFLGMSRDGLQVSYPVFLLITLPFAAVSIAAGYWGMRSRQRQLEVAQRLTSTPSPPSEAVIDGLDVVHAAGHVAPTAIAPRPHRNEEVLWFSGGMPVGMKSMVSTGLDGVAKEAQPHDGVVFTDQALYLVNVVEPVRSIEVASSAHVANNIDRISSKVWPTRLTGLLEELLGREGLAGTVGADARNVRIAYHDMTSLQIKKRFLRFPLITAKLSNGTTQKFQIVAKDLDPLLTRLSTSIAPLQGHR